MFNDKCRENSNEKVYWDNVKEKHEDLKIEKEIAFKVSDLKRDVWNLLVIKSVSVEGSRIS